MMYFKIGSSIQKVIDLSPISDLHLVSEYVIYDLGLFDALNDAKQKCKHTPRKAKKVKKKLGKHIKQGAITIERNNKGGTTPLSC